MPAPTSSGRCGHPPASRTRACPTRCTSTELVAPDTVNTMPEKTLEATFDHGEHRRRHRHRRLRRGARGARPARRASASTSPTSPRCSKTKASRSSSSRGTSCWTPSTAALERPGDRPMSFEHPRSAGAASGRRRDPARSWWPTSSRRASPAEDPTLWGPDAEAEAAKRLGWVDAVACLASAGRRDRRAPRRAASPRASTASSSPAWAAPRSRPR